MGMIINVQNTHFAKGTKTTSNGINTYKWEEPQHVQGLEKVTITPITAKGEKYGDGILRKKKSKRTGYTLGVDLNEVPAEIKRYINGLTYKDGVETDDGACSGGAFALGFEHVKEDDTVEKIWFIWCEAEPIEEENQQSTGDINISSDTLAITAYKLEEYENRAYVKIWTGDSNVTEEMAENFFKQVQTNDEIVAPKTKVNTPTANPVSGTTFADTQEVTLACATDGASIYYTVDGTEPTTSSTEYTAPIELTATTTIKAIAVKTDLTNSDVLIATYTKQ